MSTRTATFERHQAHQQMRGRAGSSTSAPVRASSRTSYRFPLRPGPGVTALSEVEMLRLQRAAGNRAVVRLVSDRSPRAAAGQAGPAVDGPAQASPSAASGSLPIQRAIGLEIEVPVPIDKLDHDATEYIEEKAGGPTHNASLGDKLSAKGRRDQEGKVDYGTVIEDDKVRVDVDHDDRVKTPNPYVEGEGWPLPEGGLDSIIEIVTKPARTKKLYNQQMDRVDAIVKNIKTRTSGLTRHWEGAWSTPTNIGPLDYTSQGRAAKKQAHHNFDGSVQVNIGVGLEGYGDMLDWYASSDYADPTKAKPTDRPAFVDAKAHIEAAVAAAKAEGDRLRHKYRKSIRPEHNGLKGIEGWLTHVALYLIRGTAQGVGGTMKNLAPVLLKSPTSIASENGMTPEEIALYSAHLNNIMTGLLERVNRNKDAKWFGKWKGRKVFPGQADAQGGDITLENLSNIQGATQDVLLTGKPIDKPGKGNDMVVEFRTLPGYHQPDEWRALGLDFYEKALELKQKRTKPTK